MLSACGSDDTTEASGSGDVCASLSGERITLVVPYNPGAGYDLEARTIAPYLAKQIDSQVVVVNQPGAGGLLALNNLLKAKADGTTIAVMNGLGAGGASLSGAKGAPFKMDDFTYLAGLSAQPVLVVAGAKSKYTSVEDVQGANGFRFGSTGPGASNYMVPIVLKKVLGLDTEVVTGFASAGEIEVAMEQGNVDGVTGDPSVYEPLVKAGDVTPLLVVGAEGLDAFPDTPTIGELNLPAEEQPVVDAFMNLLQLGRPFVGPPDMDKDVTECLRSAFDAAAKDPAFAKDVKQQNRPLIYADGKQMDDTIQNVLKTPAELVDLLKEAI